LTLEYTYDANGNQLTLQSTNASGVNITYAYDALNRLTNVVDNALTNSTKNTVYGFDGVGNLQWIKLNPIAPTAVTNYYQYDAQNRLTNLLWKVGGTTLGSFGYTLNTVGSRTQLIQSLSTEPTTFNWSYDALKNEKGVGQWKKVSVNGIDIFPLAAQQDAAWIANYDRNIRGPFIT
jgi:YD repeat-containing protein